MFNLEGQRALVLGGTSGIGRAAAEALKSAGADVTVASRSAARVDAAKSQIGCAGEVLDVTCDDDVAAFFGRSVPWDHIVVSISTPHSGGVKGMALEDAFAAMDAKFWSAYRVARCANIVPEGTLTLVSGQVGKRPNANSVLQGAINAGLEGLARGLALELSPTRVNVVAPGLIDTPLHDRFPQAARDQVFKSTAERLPVKRIGAADDVAQAILFLVRQRFATGSVVRVDGGATVA